MFVITVIRYNREEKTIAKYAKTANLELKPYFN